MGKISILLAEDEAFIARLYKKHLEAQPGVTVKTVGNGKQVLMAMESEAFDVVLLDLIMPMMDGYEVLGELQKSKKKHSPVIVLTNLTQESDREQCMALGAVDYIVKSDIDAPQLWERVKKHLK